MDAPVIWALALVALAAVVVFYEWRDARAAEQKLREAPRVVDYMPIVPGCRECKLAREANATVLARHAVSVHGWPHDA